MKKLLSLLVSAAFVAMPLATVSTAASAATPSVQAQAEKKEVTADHSLRPSVLIELGECWQHLRQFDKALGFYTQAIAAADSSDTAPCLRIRLDETPSICVFASLE